MKKTGVKIYNLFPRLAGPFANWTSHLQRAAKMGFDWLYVNPLHFPGFSGSLYAIKDYYKINPIFLTPGSNQDEFSQLKEIIELANRSGSKMMMDLVINHTAIDSALVTEHPAWYKWENGKIVNPSCMDPADARKITVWGDLAEIDNLFSVDCENLWAYWERLCLFYAETGFRGFRCDAAYQVPVALWQRLINAVKSRYPDFIFVAETLGCKEKDIMELARAGFDYLYNSSKWWDFKAAWCLRQYNQSRLYAPSISFAETHDTPRLAEETNNDINYIKMRYFFSALFSRGLLMPMGFEFGFRQRLHVVATIPQQWEPVNFDLTGFIKKINRFKETFQIFNEDNPTFSLDCVENNLISGLIKISNDSKEKVIILINTDRTQAQEVKIYFLPSIFQAAGKFQVISPEQEPTVIGDSFEAWLAPSEIKVIYCKI